MKGDIPKYLTIGKEYEVIHVNKYGIATALSDDGYMFDAYIYGDSARLGGGCWEVIE